MDDQVFRSLLVEVEDRDHTAEQLLLQPERRSVVAAASLVAGTAAQGLVEARREAGQVSLRGRLCRVDDLLAEEVAFEQQNQEDFLRLQRDEVDMLDPRQ